MNSVHRIPRIYPILDGPTIQSARGDLLESAEALIEGGANWLQFRWKEGFSHDVFRTANAIAALCKSAGTVFFINDRADMARLLEAGLHVGQLDLPPSDARQQIGPNRILGLSTHNREQFLAGDREPVDYLALGPIFPTRSKVNPDPVVGLDGLREFRPHSTKALVAIGGIDLENAPAVWKSGADSVAVISSLYAGGCSKSSVRQRLEEWQKLARNA